MLVSTVKSVGSTVLNNYGSSTYEGSDIETTSKAIIGTNVQKSSIFY